MNSEKNIYNSNDPIITIVVAVLNSSATISRCLDSITGQNYHNVELVIVDGGSTDGTVSLIQQYKKIIDYFDSSPDEGIYDAWNKALPHVTGGWVLFLGGDDYLHGNHVLKDVATLLQTISSEISVAYGRVQRINPVTGKKTIIGDPWSVASQRIWDYSPVPHQGTFHRRSLFENCGYFDASFAIAGDYELLLREFKNHPAFFIPSPVISVMQEGGISTNGINARTILLELRRAQERHGHYKGKLFWFAAHARAWMKLAICKLFNRKLSFMLIAICRRLHRSQPY